MAKDSVGFARFSCRWPVLGPTTADWVRVLTFYARCMHSLTGRCTSEVVDSPHQEQVTVFKRRLAVDRVTLAEGVPAKHPRACLQLRERVADWLESFTSAELGVEPAVVCSICQLFLSFAFSTSVGLQTWRENS